MALYVPQLGDLSAASGVRSLRESIVRMAQEERERNREMAERLRYGDQQKRQGIQDRQGALVKASELWKAGDREGAMAIMAPYGGKMEGYEVDAPQDWAPRLNQGELDFADSLPMNRPGGPVAAPQPQRPKLDPMNFSFGDQQAPPDNSEQPDLEGLMQQALPAQPNPIMAAYQATQQRNKVMAQRLKGQFEDGTPWSIDPDAGRRESLARADKAFYEASGEDTPEAEQVREQYPQLRATYQAAGQDIDPKQVFTQFRADAAGQRQEQAATERERMRIAAEERRNEEWNRRFPLQESGRDRRAALAAANRGAAIKQGETRIELATEASAREATNKVFGNLGFKDIQVGNRKFNDMASNLASVPNAALDAVTAGTFVKMAQGGTGVISDSDMRVFWERIGGLGMKAEAAIQGLVDGTLPPDKRAIVLKAVQELAGTARRNLSTVQQALEHQFDTSPTLKPYKDQMVGTYFPRYRARVQNRESSKQGGAGKVDMSPYEEMMK